MCHFILLGEDHHVVELPGAIIEGGNVSIHMRMLADDGQTFIVKRMSQVCQDHSQLWILDRHLIKQPGATEREGGITVERCTSVEENGDPLCLTILVDRLAALVAGIKSCIDGSHFEAAKAKSLYRALQLPHVSRLCRIARSEAHKLLGRSCDEIGNILVRDPVPGAPGLESKDHHPVKGGHFFHERVKANG